jgi:hypothetical protein
MNKVLTTITLIIGIVTATKVVLENSKKIEKMWN